MENNKKEEYVFEILCDGNWCGIGTAYDSLEEVVLVAKRNSEFYCGKSKSYRIFKRTITAELIGGQVGDDLTEQ